jgi:hypothetical protein
LPTRPRAHPHHRPDEPNGPKRPSPSARQNSARSSTGNQARNRWNGGRPKWGKLVGAVGIGPTTFGLKGRCSTTELRPYKSIRLSYTKWSWYYTATSRLSTRTLSYARNGLKIAREIAKNAAPSRHKARIAVGRRKTTIAQRWPGYRNTHHTVGCPAPYRKYPRAIPARDMLIKSI